MSDGIQEFGPYLVYELLGQGGMATVHRAEKRGVGVRRPVALKRLLPHIAADPALVNLFVDEARLAAHLHHPNVAQTYDLGRVGDTFFIAMEYASGPTLTQIIRQCQKIGVEIPVAVTISILIQVCEALDYAHNLRDPAGQPLRIIHRDVSPGNIVVTNTGVVKLIDFGIAKATTSRVQTQAGLIKGKYGYIAPEYITGQIDARVDLFATGVIAHELLSGRRLFEAKDDFETLTNVRELVIQPPSHWNAGVTPLFDDIVMTALVRDPARRWQSAGALQVALSNMAREHGVSITGAQLIEWVAWAFSQIPPASAPVSAPGAPSKRDSPSIQISIAPRHGSLAPPAGLERAASASESSETVPVERVRIDFNEPLAAELNRAAPGAAQRLSRQHQAVAPPAPSPRSRPLAAGSSHPQPRSSRPSEAPPPSPRVSRPHEVPPPAPRVSRPLEAQPAPRVLRPPNAPTSRDEPRTTVDAPRMTTEEPRTAIDAPRLVDGPRTTSAGLRTATDEAAPPVRKLKPRGPRRQLSTTSPPLVLPQAQGSQPLVTLANPPAPVSVRPTFPGNPNKRLLWVLVVVLALATAGLAALYFWPQLTR